MHIGYIIIGHGEYSVGMFDAINLILGAQNNIKALTFEINESPDELYSKIIQSIDELNCDYYIIFTDILGGTPYNTAALIAEKDPRIEVITGANLSMLLEAILRRDTTTDLNLLKKIIIENAINGIKINSELIKKSYCETNNVDNEGI